MNPYLAAHLPRLFDATQKPAGERQLADRDSGHFFEDFGLFSGSGFWIVADVFAGFISGFGFVVAPASISWWLPLYIAGSLNCYLASTEQPAGAGIVF